MHWVAWAGMAYWIAFVATFLAVAVWESARPWRPLHNAAGRRWRSHAALFAVCALSAAALRLSPVALAFAMRDSPFGLLNRPWVPAWLAFALTIPALDLVNYAIHRLFHSVYLLWRVHEVHHSDCDYDVSTAVRFHPLEVLMTQGIYLGAIALLAPPVAGVFTAEMLVVAWNLFVHANKALPPAVERVLRRLLITPDLHRIHHSEERAEQNRNFGQMLPWWDRIFGSYAQESGGMLAIGVRERRGEDMLRVHRLLASPLFLPKTPAVEAQHGNGD